MNHTPIGRERQQMRGRLTLGIQHNAALGQRPNGLDPILWLPQNIPQRDERTLTQIIIEPKLLTPPFTRCDEVRPKKRHNPTSIVRVQQVQRPTHRPRANTVSGQTAIAAGKSDSPHVLRLQGNNIPKIDGRLDQPLSPHPRSERLLSRHRVAHTK